MIETANLILRPHRREDFEPWLAMFKDEELFRFIGVPNLSREDAWNRLLRYVGHWALLGYGLFAVIDRTSDTFLGEVGMADFRRGLGERFDPFPEAAWIMTRAAHGRGLALEAAFAAHSWIEQSRAPTRTVCLIHPENVASLRLADKLGYREFDMASYKGELYAMLARNGSVGRKTQA